MFQALEFIRNHPNDAPPYSIVAQIGNFDRGNRIQIVGRIIDINEGRPIAGRRLNEIQITIEDREGIHPVTVMMASNLRHLQVLEDRRTHA
ncbi:MAG: hypothetical protein HZB76_04165 [Chlamydiae bacterium]|nr:hypothetical protein [Chlamydiota bacterium]